MVSKKVMRWGGVISLVIGVLFLLHVAGIYTWLPAGASALSVAGQPVGISIASSITEYPFLAQVGPKGTYQWRVSVTNTGIDWDEAWFCVRMLKRTSTPVLVSHPTYGGNQFYVGQCDGKQDDVQCRENIESSSPDGWDMRWRTDTLWSDISDGKMNDQVFCPSFGPLSKGQSKTWYFSLTVPDRTDIYGDYPVIATSGAKISGYGWIIASNIDTLTVGTVDGSLTFAFLGSTLSILGAIALALSRKP